MVDLVKLVKVLEFEGDAKKNEAMDTLEAEGKICKFLESKKFVNYWSRYIDVQNFTLVLKGCLMLDDM